MTVRELMKQLIDCDPEAQVIIRKDDGEFAHLELVTDHGNKIELHH